MSDSVQFAPPGTGAQFFTGDAHVTQKIHSEHTAGAFELFEVDALSLESPAPPHRVGWANVIYVLRGYVTVNIDGADYELTPGACISIPPRRAFMCTVQPPSAKLLLFTTTGANGRFFADLDAVLKPGAQPDPELLASVVARHDVSLAESPLGK